MDKNKIAFLFVGQGSQKTGMAKDLYDNFQVCKEVIDKGEDILKMPIKEHMFNGSEEEIKQTEIAQPAIVLESIAIMKALQEKGIEASYTAGLSLGEYSSLVYSNILSTDDALRVVKERGKIMGSSLPKGLGKMAAVLKLDNESVKELIKKCSAYGIIEGVNYNCPGQVAIAGENEAIDMAIKEAKEMGGKAVELKVSGPFHSSLLKDASEEFYKSLENVEVNEPSLNVYSNYKGDLYDSNDDVKFILKKHIMSPVYFETILRDMMNRGVDTFIEIGPGKALSGFVKRINRKVKTFNIEDVETFNKTVDSLKNLGLGE